jgi:beta-galactosidase
MRIANKLARFTLGFKTALFKQVLLLRSVITGLKAPLIYRVALMLFLAPATGFSQALTDDPSVINDHMFPAQPAAKPFSDFDSKGFLVNGKRTFLVSAGIEYARMPHQLWQDRLLRLKRAGFNCVEIYTIWNFHEPLEGKFEFSGDHDLDGFLALVKKLGMYAIVRVGPYYCAEWDQGGYPVWLRFKPGLRVREPNALFEKYVDRYFDHLLPLVMKHQINRGGPVILVQLENEHPKGWGTIMPDQYFKHLQEKALGMGLQVPYFFSGVHHSTDPAGDSTLDDAARPNPWFSTEYWSMWYTQYGARKGDAAKYDRSTWKIIANGGSGYNIYMAYGGSNFGYTNNDEDAASYDYGAAVGQAGDLRPLYYTFKRAAYFARSFQDILENSSDAFGKYQKLMKSRSKLPDTAVRLMARTSPAGDLIFLDNPGSRKAAASIAVDQAGLSNKTDSAFPGSLLPEVKVNLKPGEIYPVIHNFRLNSSTVLDWAVTRVYGISKQNHTTTILVQAEAGEQVVMRFLLKTAIHARLITGGQSGVAAKNEFKQSGNRIVLNTIAKAVSPAGKAVSQPASYSFRTGKDFIRILVMSAAEMDYTWNTENPAVNGIVTGVPYLAEVKLEGGKIIANAESPLVTRTVPENSTPAGQSNAAISAFSVPKNSASGHIVPGLQGSGAKIYLEHGSQELSVDNSQQADRKGAFAKAPSQSGSQHLQQEHTASAIGLTADLTDWAYKNASLSAAPDFDDSKWLKTEDPVQMGADQDISADAWYRTKISIPEAGMYSMQAEGGDRGTIFIDGHQVAKWKIKTAEVSLHMDKGEHTMAIFTAHNGRDKMAAYLGPIDNIDKKGLDGKVRLKKGGPFYQTLENWYFLKAGNANALKSSIPVLDTVRWKKYKVGADAFNLREGFGWFATVIPAQPGLSRMTVSFKSVDENATVFINGKQMIRREGWNIPFDFSITDAELLRHPMVVTVFVENHDKEGGIDQAVKINTIGDAEIISGWKMRGGPEEDKQAAWQKYRLHPTDSVSGPRFYRASFTLPRIQGTQLIWRVNPDGMGHGSVWVNGHHIGRYPELNGRIGTYIPEPWLKTGRNELVIYEEEGRAPAGLTITTEQDAGRKTYQLNSRQLLKQESGFR